MNQEHLKSILAYDPIEGVFTWLRSSPRVKAGSLAGGVSTKYHVISINKVSYSTHRLAWLYMTGSWPEDQIDHIDKDRLNNKWKNLRACNASENQRNRRMHKNNTSGYKGVWLHKPTGKWIAQIRVNKKKIVLGGYATPEEASRRYIEAAKDLHGEFFSG